MGEGASLQRSRGSPRRRDRAAGRAAGPRAELGAQAASQAWKGEDGGQIEFWTI